MKLSCPFIPEGVTNSFPKRTSFNVWSRTNAPEFVFVYLTYLYLQRATGPGDKVYRHETDGLGSVCVCVCMLGILVIVRAGTSENIRV